ncbi:MAG: gamma-glutamyltransferase family protein [Trueperaceae bacterium]|nr:MAG: gamma-glutamyltransferase family protein [Trueperaceae bacterium]
MTLDFTTPYASQRMPVMARNVVATSQPLAAQAGLRALQRGGNAVDAAIAAAAVLTVVEPTGNGLGSDAFALVWDGARLHGLNASGRSPRSLTPERFGAHDAMPYRGWDTVTVPGAVSGWVALHERFAALPFASLLEDAVRYADEGFAVSPIIARGWDMSRRTYTDQPDWQRDFAPAGRVPSAGEIWRFPQQARSLERIAETGGEALYRGHLADAIVAHARANGALLDHADLAEHRPEWVEPIATWFADHELHEIPPNGQGLAALIALGILRHRPDLRDHELDSAPWLHLQIEAMKLALADAERWIADPEHMTEVRAADLLDDDYLAARAATIDPERAADPGHGTPRPSGTVYLSTADADGRMVSFIQSNYAGFGSGVVVPETGIALQNRGAGFVLTPDHPNRVGGGKRPFHTIIPGFLTHGGDARCAFGVMGGMMQAQGHVQMTLRMVGHQQNPQAASDAPRWRVTGGRGVALEAGVPDAVAQALVDLGHVVQRSAPDESFGFGGAQLIWRDGHGGYVAGSDHRKDGQAVGY